MCYTAIIKGAVKEADMARVIWQVYRCKLAWGMSRWSAICATAAAVGCTREVVQRIVGK